VAGPNQIPGPTAIRAPTLDLKNHQTILTQLKETTETASRQRGNPLQSYVKLGELVDAGIVDYLGGTVSPGKNIGGGGISSVTTADSIQGDGSAGSPIELVGDAASPGNNKYFGTNGSGSKGYFSFPAAANVPTEIGAQWTQVPFGSTLALPTNPVLRVAPRGGTILEVRIYTIGGVGSCVIDVWKTTTGNVPTSGNDITGGSPPTISSGTSYLNNTLSGWTTTVTAEDVFLFTLASVSGAFTYANIVVRIG
jgi:hypothetical protein